MNRCRTLLRRPHDRGRGDSNDRVRGRNESGQDRPHHGHDRDACVRHGLHHGGDGEATIIARVGEGIVTTVGSSEEHTDVLENPDHISRTVLGKGLDAGTAFEILSIDIADVDVGRNIGAQLQTDQAEADKKIAQARAEERRAMAVATEQEMRAKTQDMQAKVVEAQAEVPKALAEAFRSGNLGVMDYYNMNNIIADTKMRENLADSE